MIEHWRGHLFMWQNNKLTDSLKKHYIDFSWLRNMWVFEKHRQCTYLVFEILSPFIVEHVFWLLEATEVAFFLPQIFYLSQRYDEVYWTPQLNGLCVTDNLFINTRVTTLTIWIRALVKCYYHSYNYLRDCSQRCSYDFKSDNHSSLVSH